MVCEASCSCLDAFQSRQEKNLVEAKKFGASAVLLHEDTPVCEAQGCHRGCESAGKMCNGCQTDAWSRARWLTAMIV